MPSGSSAALDPGLGAVMAGENRVLRDRYELIAELGRGGMGVVWRAYDRSLERFVAIKQIDLTSNRDSVGRTIREARITAMINHPNIVKIHDIFEEGSTFFAVMELIDGFSLDGLIESGSLDPAAIRKILLTTASALAVAHGQGIAHRDIKPQNIIVDRGGNAHLVDFGISRTVDHTRITAVGAVIGTLAYMAPEVARDEPATSASDMWSLGATIYCCFEGHAPFVGPQGGVNVHALTIGTPPAPARAGELTDLVVGLLQSDPSSRPSARDVVHHLESTPPAPAPRPPDTTRLEPVPDPPPADPPLEPARSGPDSSGSTRPPTVPGAPPGRRRVIVLAIGAALLVAIIVIGAVLLVRGEPGTGQVAGTQTSAAAPASESGSGSAVNASTTTAPTSSRRTDAPALPRSAPLGPNQLLVQADATASDGSTVPHLYLAEVGNPNPLRDLTPGDAAVNEIGLTGDRRSISWRQSGDPADTFRVAAADGSGARTLTVEAMPEGCQKSFRPAWNPADPTQFVATCRPGVGSTITIFNTAGEVVTRLDTGQQKFTDVTFTPDGASIVYAAEDLNDGDGGALWILAVTGSAPAVALTQPTIIGQDADPAISPDGSTVAFRRRVDPTGERNFDLWLMNIDGRNARPLLTGAPDDQDPSWSPDGSSIAFKSDRSDGDVAVGTRDRVWVVTPAGGQVGPIWGDDVAGSQTTPAWYFR